MDSNDRLSFLGRELPEAFVLKILTLAPESEEPYREEDWADAIVIVERGELEVECQAGGRKLFRRGADGARYDDRAGWSGVHRLRHSLCTRRRAGAAA